MGDQHHGPAAEGGRVPAAAGGVPPRRAGARLRRGGGDGLGRGRAHRGPRQREAGRPAHHLPATRRQHHRDRRSGAGAAAAAARVHPRSRRPVGGPRSDHDDPRLHPGRRDRAHDLDCPGHSRGVRVPAQRVGDGHSRRGGPALPDRDVRRDVPDGLQHRQPVADGADDLDGIRGRRCDRRHREHHASPGARAPPARRRVAGRARGRLHRPLDEHLVGRRLPPDPVDGRHRWPALPRVRGGPVGRRRRVARRLPDHDADDVRAVPEAEAGERARASLPGQRTGVRVAPAALRSEPLLGAAARPAHHGGGGDHRVHQRLPLRGRPQRVLPGAGQRPPDGGHPGRSGHVVSGAPAEARAVRGSRDGGPGRRQRRRTDGRHAGNQQHGPDVHRPQTGGRAEAHRRRGHHAAPPEARQRARRDAVPPGDPGHPRGRTAQQRVVSVHAAGRRPAGAESLGAPHAAEAPGAGRPDRREQRSAESWAGGVGGHRPRHRLAARDLAADDRRHPLRRLRPAAGVDHVYPVESVPRRDGGGAAILAEPRDPPGHLRPRRERGTGAAQRLHPLRADDHGARGQSPGAVPRRHPLVQRGSPWGTR